MVQIVGGWILTINLVQIDLLVEWNKRVIKISIWPFRWQELSANGNSDILCKPYKKDESVYFWRELNFDGYEERNMTQTEMEHMKF